MTQRKEREETKPLHLKVVIGVALKNIELDGLCMEVMYTPS
jgi:hypothetical protein